MSETAKEPRFLITPIQWIIGGLVVVVAAGLLIVSARKGPKPQRVETWLPPGATMISSSTLASSWRAPMDITNATAWYANRLGVGFGGRGASFQYRSTGITPFSRGYQHFGVNRFGSPTNAESTMFLINRDGQASVINLTQHAGERGTIVDVVHAAARSGGRRGDPMLAPFPRITTSGSSSAGDMHYHTSVALTNSAAISEWYARQFNATTGAVGTLSPASGRSRPECRLFRVTDNTVTFVYAVETGSNTMDIVVGTTWR